MLGAHVLVAELRRLALRLLRHASERGREHDGAAARHLGERLEGALEAALHLRHRDLRRLEDGGNGSVFLRQKRPEQMLGAHFGMIRPVGPRFGIGECLLALRRQFIETHFPRALLRPGVNLRPRYLSWARLSFASVASGLFGYFWMIC